MSDSIDRQAAIEAIEEMQIPIMRSIFPEEQFVFKGMSEALSAIKELPSAQPEQRWIPCSERLPEDSGWHIVTKELDYDTTFVGLEWYDSTNGWKYDNSKCIAWMPLPEPYKREQE